MIKFEYQFDGTSPKVQIELHADSSLSEVVIAFESFLRASGFSFHGNIDIVYPEDSHDCKCSQDDARNCPNYKEDPEEDGGACE